MIRKHTAILMASLLTLASTSAHAEAPASQFGYRGWFYQQSVCETPSASTEPTPFPTFCPSEDENGDGSPSDTPVIPTREPASATLQPTATPTTAISPVPTAIMTASPTEKPSATRIPSMDEDYNTNSVSAQEQIAYKLLIQDRNTNGLPALTLDPALSDLARIKANDMRDNHYFAHESPTYGNASAMLTTFGYAFNGVGENIAHHATVEKAQAAFMSSTGHRRNILSSAWTKVGIGVSYDAQGYVYVVQLFVR